LIVNLSKKHGITGYESPEAISATDADQFVAKLFQSVAQNRQSQQVTKDEMKEGEDRLLAQLSLLKSEMAGFEEGKKNCRKQLESNRNKIASITNKIHSSRVSMGDVENQTARVEEEVLVEVNYVFRSVVWPLSQSLFLKLHLKQRLALFKQI
jgi:predicted  nucleic acid-binding Zn-ribbon protein